MEEVVKLLFPDKRAVPPVAAAYQSVIPPPGGVAEIVTVPGPHLEAEVPEGAAGMVLMVAVTAVLVGEIPPQLMFLACAK